MEINIYKKYDYSYDEKQFMKSFKEALVEKGYTSLGLFYSLLKKFDKDFKYETAKSYYNLRRVVPLKLFAYICNYLDLNATKLMYPNSIFEYNFSRTLVSDADSGRTTYLHFISVFDCKENIEYLINDIGSERFNESTKNDIYFLSLILAKYNYLLQRYYYASLSNSELIDFRIFSEYHIVDRKNNAKFDFNEFEKWKKEIKTTNFLDVFYQKYTLSFEGRKCSEILKENKSCFTKEIFDLINNLFYKLDKVE